MVRCNSCGGTYEPVTDDGMQYFHACPPLSPAELKRALDAGTVTLSPVQARRLALAQSLDGKAKADGVTVSQADDFLSTLAIARPGHRDENVPSTQTKHAGKVKAEGRGVTDVTVDHTGALVDGATHV